MRNFYRQDAVPVAQPTVSNQSPGGIYTVLDNNTLKYLLGVGDDGA